MHETLVLACAEALRDTRQGFGNVFSQVDYLCKLHGVPMHERIAIQQMRYHSNGKEEISAEDWRYDLRALALFISIVFKADVPHPLLTSLPVERKTETVAYHQSFRSLRCIVTGWDDNHIYATTDKGAISIDAASIVGVDTTEDELSVGMQLNLLDGTIEGTTVTSALIVVEPDFLVDISTIAACFQEYGHHPISSLLSRLKSRANSQQILLGNFAGSALDDVINQSDFQYADTLCESFRDQALQFCTCEPFNGQQFKQDSQQQVTHIREAVDVLFGEYDREHALLEPSFVCEQLGLQGRVDLMTDDLRLLVEQKSGKNWHIERGASQQHKEDHYVQLLLYYGVLRYNFHLSPERVDIRLLYSKYPARQGLLVVSFYQQLFREAIHLRNRIVAQEIKIAREGFNTIIPSLRANDLLENPEKSDFFDHYIRPAVESQIQAFHQLTTEEQAYVERMLSFVYREQLAQKVGTQEGLGGVVADLWNMPLAEKQETGNILMGTVVDKTIETVTLKVDMAEVLPNFRRGDMVYLYQYNQEPDVCNSILYKGTLVSLTDSEVTIRLSNRQQNPHVFGSGCYAIEHASSDVGTTSALRAVYSFCFAKESKRQLLLGLRSPRKDTSITLSHSYHPNYDEVLLKASQSCDYFLLQGPPGTGKTSMALRFLVQEELENPQHTLLLTAYTHRAVDEICGMLTDAQLDYLRIGSEDSCDPRYASHLLEHLLGDTPKLNHIREQLQRQRIIVATTSTLQARPFLFQLKHFSLCIVDEASQILAPNILGILLSDAVERFILVGDHKQLPAVVQQPDDEPRLRECRQSLFEWLLHVEEKANRTDFVGLLRYQGRMHPDIAAFPNEFFYRREQLLPVPCPHQLEEQLDYQEPSEDALDEQLKQHRVLFIPSDTSQTGVNSLSDKVSEEEAHIVADLLHRVYRQYGEKRFEPYHTVGVIVPYRNQIAMIRREIARLDIPALEKISIDTVERYQGSQRDVIIYSFTVQRPYQLDFLTANSFVEDGCTIDRKLNVAMTRARKQLLMTGKAEILRRNEIFAQLISRYSI